MKIAVIGGIGSGKSYVLNLIAGFGERVCDCDAIYKEISVTDDYVKSIAKVFDVVKDGVIDRKKLAETVFSDREKLINNLALKLKNNCTIVTGRYDDTVNLHPLLQENGFKTIKGLPNVYESKQ